MKLRLFLAFFLLKTSFSTAQTCSEAFLYEANIRSMLERGSSVWVGTDLGLVEIDRASRAVLNRFDRNNSVLDGPVTALATAADGSLLVGTNSLWRTADLSNWTKILDPKADIRDIHPLNDSVTWVSTSVGMWRLGKTANGEFFHKGNSKLPNNWCNRARHDQWGNTWIGVGQPFSQGGLVKVPANGAPWVVFKKPDAPLPQTSAVRDLLVDSEGSVWLVAEDKVLKLDTAGKWTTLDPEPSFAGDYNACSISQKPTGEIVVGMENTVSIEQPGGGWKIEEMPGLFADNVFIFNTLAASDGSVWVGSNINGLSVLDGNQTHAVATSVGALPLAPVTSVGVSPGGEVWAGTAFGGLESRKGGAWTIIDSLMKEQASVQILDIQFDTDGLPVILLNSLWQQWKMLKWDGSKFTEWTSGFSGFNGKRRLRHAGDAWYVSSTRGLFQWKNNTLALFDTLNSGISTNFIADMDDDGQGNIWMSTINRGLCLFDGSGFVRFDSAHHGLPTDSLLAVTVAADGRPFFSDSKGNLFRLTGTTFEKWRDTTALADDRIALLEGAPNGGIWLNNRSGATRFDPGANKWLAFSGSDLPFVVADGQARSLLWDGGSIWIGKNSGLYRIDESCLPSVSTGEAGEVLGEISVFPNPAGEAVSFGFSLKKRTELGLRLVDIAGRSVFSSGTREFAKGENQVDIGLAGLPSGIYFYQISGEGRAVKAGKLVKI